MISRMELSREQSPPAAAQESPGLLTFGFGSYFFSFFFFFGGGWGEIIFCFLLDFFFYIGNQVSRHLTSLSHLVLLNIGFYWSSAVIGLSSISYISFVMLFKSNYYINCH